MGLAAGFDKDAVAVRGLAALGFGFVEVGTVTPLPQPGNPRPRLFRFSEAESLQNAMGFNNGGMEAMRRRLEPALPAGGPARGQHRQEQGDAARSAALDDYEILIRGLAHLCDYLVVNLSSPNTPGCATPERDVPALGAGAGQGDHGQAGAGEDRPGPGAGRRGQTSRGGGRGRRGRDHGHEHDERVRPAAGAQGLRRALRDGCCREKSFRVFEAVARRLFGRTVLISVGGIDSGAEA